MDNLRTIIDSITEKKRMPILLGIIMLAIVLQIYNIGNKSLWLDEVFSFRFASLNLIDILASPDKPHPPLYYAILHFFLYLGKSEFFMRLPSVISSVLCIPLVYRVGKDFFEYRVGLLSAFLLAISPFFYWFAQEARMYTLFALFSLLSLIFFYNAIQRNDVRLWIGFIVSTSMSIYTHYFAFFLILIDLLFIAVFIKRYQIILNRFFLSLTAIFVLFLPQIMSLFLGIVKKTEEETRWGMSPSLFFVPKIFKSLSIGEFDIPHSWLFTVLLFVIFLYGIYNSFSEREEKIGLSVISIFTPVLIASLLAFKMNFGAKYVIFILPIYLVIISKGLIDIMERRSAIFLALVLIILASNAYSLHVNYDHSKEDWKSVASVIKDGSLPGDNILVIDEFTDPLTYYDLNPIMIRKLNIKTGEDLGTKIQKILLKTKRVWIPYSTHNRNKLLLNWLNQNCIKKYEFYHTKVYLCKYNSSAPRHTEGIGNS